MWSVEEPGVSEVLVKCKLVEKGVALASRMRCIAWHAWELNAVWGHLGFLVAPTLALVARLLLVPLGARGSAGLESK